MSSELFKYVFDPIADQQLTEIFKYISEKLCNQKAAQDLYDSFFEEITRIRNFPESGEVRYEDIRRVPVKNYWLYYIPLQQTKTIYIVAITHSSQKFANENLN